MIKVDRNNKFSTVIKITCYNISVINNNLIWIINNAFEFDEYAYNNRRKRI